MKDYSELKRLALAARYANASFVTLRDFSVATSPAAVLALIADLHDYQQGAKAEADAGEEARAEVRRLKAEVEVLRKEVARFDFIQQDAPSIFENVYGENWLDVVDSYVFPTKALGHD